MLKTTRFNLMLDVGTKGGGDNPLFADGKPLTQIESATGTRFKTGFREFKDIDQNEQNMGLQEFVPPNCYHPVKLMSRGEGLVE